MKDIKQIIFERLVSGDISESAGVELLSSLKKQKRSDVPVDMAIIGLAVRYPGANSCVDFSRNMEQGKDCVSSLPLKRLHDVRMYLDYCSLEDSHIPKGGYLDRIDCFDHRFFHLSAKEASLMDPHQRLFLQAAWEAIDDAGYGNDALKGSRTGVFVGFGDDSYYRRMIQEVDEKSLSMSTVGNIKSVIAGRIAFLLDLKGPNMLIDTACSSSLVAVHLACQSIRNGECEYALAGGVKLVITPSVDAPSLGIESQEYRIKTFDDNSDGITWGEGVGAILIKPLEQAVRDGDIIHAVIKGCAVNNDGKTIGLTAPSAAMQEEVIVEAWESAGIDPEKLSYIEAHGTSTQLGDPIEMQAINRAFRRYTEKKQFCGIGTVKTSIGHLDHAAGIAGLINAALAVREGYLPVSLHLHRPNRIIPFIQAPVYVNTLPDRPLDIAGKRMYGVSGFGLSGTNCHVVLEEGPVIPPPEEIPDLSHIFTLSAYTLQALHHYIQRYLTYLSDLFNKGLLPRFEDICYTVCTGRSHFQYRIAIHACNLCDLYDKLRQVSGISTDCECDHGVFFAHNTVAFEEKSRENEHTISLDAKIRIDRRAEHIVDEYQTNTELVRKDLLYELCVLYVQGADIQWKRLYEGHKCRKISLPSYPFEATRCWPEIPARNYDDFFYRMTWRHEEHLPQDGWDTDTENTLFVCNTETELSDVLCQQLSVNQRGLPVISFSNYTRGAVDIPTVLSSIASDVVQAVTDHDIKRILFFANEEETANCQPAYFDNIHFLRLLIKEMEKQGVRQEMRLVVLAFYADVVDGSEKQIRPVNAALFSFAKIIEMEHLHIQCQCIDIDHSATATEILAVCRADSQDRKIAFRRHKRYKEELDVCDLSAFDAESIPIRENGVYILAGGRGGIGLEVAGYLALQGAKDLVLINRCQFPSKAEWSSILENRTDPELCNMIEQINLIEAAGANVHCYSADITDSTQIEEVLRSLRSSLGQIHGVIHSAGLGFGRVGHRIIEDDTELFEVEASPKMIGTWILDHATREDHLDFFLIFSSPITVTGGVGVGSYIVGNAFQSAYADYRNRLGLRTLALSWAPWNHTIRKLGKHFRQEQQLFLPLSNFHAIECLHRVFSLKTDEIIVGRLNFASKLFQLQDLLTFSYSERVKARVLQDFETPEQMSHVSPNMTTVELHGRENRQYSSLEIQVGQIWANIFGLNILHINDNYYELGGDSIIAITLANRINQLLGIHTTPIDILRQPVLSSFVASIAEKYCTEIPAADTSSTKDEPIKDKRREYYDVSSAQKRSYVLNSLNPDDTRYNEPIALLLHGYVDRNQVQDAFNKMIERHEILRTSYHLIDNRPMQRIHDIHQIAISYTAAAEGDEESYENCIRDWVKPFDLGVAPLFRVHLHRLKAERYLLFLDVHHIITDGRSSEIMIHEFMHFYQGLPLSQLTVQYKDYAKWHNDLLKSPDMEKQEAYWIETLKGEAPVLRLPCRYDHHLHKPGSGGTKAVTLSADQSATIRAFAAQSNTTPYNVFLSALYILLYNYTGQDDIWIGTPVSERSLPWMNQIIGFIINSIVLRNFPKGDIVYQNFLNNVSRNTLDAVSHCHYPFDMLVEKIIQDRIVDKNPLFDVMIVMQKMQNSKSGLSATDDFYIEQVSVSTGKTKVALTLDIREYADNFTIEFEYAADLFDEAMIEGLMRHYINLLHACLSTPSRRLCDLVMMEEGEKDAILYHLNSPVALSKRHDYPVIHYFQLSVEKRPQSTAIVHGAKSITYAELNRKADAIAYQMQKRGVGFNHIIAILVTDPAETLMSVLAVLKAGGVFLVVDTRLPSARMERLLCDANPSLILTCDAYTQFLTGLSYPFIRLEEAFASEKEELVVSYATPDDAAYIIYTSGTTGTPKGILVSNGQLTNQILAIMKDIPYNEQTRHVFTIEFSFDPFIQVFLCILCAGGCLHLVPNELVTDPRNLYQYVKKQGINSMDMVPSLLSSHLAGIQPEPKLRLDILTLAGEIFSKTLYEKINTCFDVKYLFNVYGPAETVVNTTIYKCGGETVGVSVPIGKPIENYCVYILDKHLRPLPVNVEGELYISGVSVARGYLNKPKHTHENFMKNPFVPQMMMYRTGDIGKWLSDGNLVFVGRNDTMVKIRGMRVEVHEVQRVIQNIEGVKLVEVIAYKEERDTYLCAYIVGQSEISQEAITDYLHNQMPAYMVPAYFVFLSELPYNMNGKLDVRNLPHPKEQKESAKIACEPTNGFEKRLCGIWAEILNVPVNFIDPAKSFFDQGGNSLSIIILQRELEQALSREIPMPVLFSYSSIQTFQRYWQSHDAGARKAKNFGHLSCLTLPDEWILPTPDVRNRGTFTICYDVGQTASLRHAALQHGVDVRDMLLHFYGYLLADAVGLQETPILVAASSFEDLYRQITICLPKHDCNEMKPLGGWEDYNNPAIWQPFCPPNDPLGNKAENLFCPCYRIESNTQHIFDCNELCALVVTEVPGDELQLYIDFASHINKEKVYQFAALLSAMIDLAIEEATLNKVSEDTR